MPVLDSEGRLFGRMNLIDAAVAIAVLAVLPLAYGAWVLFRTPDPVIEKVQANVVADVPNQQIVVFGRNLRPYLRASIGGKPAEFLYETADKGRVELPALPAAVYYLAFFDDSKEIVRYADAVNVRPATPPPKVTIDAIAPRALDFSRNTQRIALTGRLFRPSLKGMVGTNPAIYQYESSERAYLMVPALDPGTYDVSLSDAGTEVARVPGGLTIKPEQLTPIRLTLRFVTRPEIVELMRRERDASRRSGSSTAGAVVESIEVISDVSGTTREAILDGHLNIIRVVVRVMAYWGGDAWKYNDRPLRSGPMFRFTQPEYELEGTIVNIEVLRGGGR